VGACSTYTSLVNLYCLQNREPCPFRCCQTRAAMSLVTPMYNVPNGALVIM
jgi:hypothetical protein